MKQKVYLGIDVGSVSTNVILLDVAGRVLEKLYIRTNGQPLESVRDGLRRIHEAYGETLQVEGVGTTGSGRQLVGIMIGADVVKNEITAHAAATINLYPNARTIFEIGGQDSKIIIIRDGVVVDFAMNTVCAAGTGSFLDHQAERLRIPIEEFGSYALKAKREVRIAGRCTVFAESDMIAKQQFGFSKAEIINGLCEALVRNYINNLGRGKDLRPPFVFQGGVAANIGIRAAFEHEVGSEIIVPEHYNVMGAIGAALLARSHRLQTEKPSYFKGFQSADMDFVPVSFECAGCTNQCEVVKVEQGGQVVAMWGDRCGKWSSKVAN